MGALSIPGDFHVFKANLATLPNGDELIVALAMGFSAALLGISGFESSANFVEEQEAGVSERPLRNMLVAVAIINPLISVLSLNLLPIDQIIAYKENLLSHMAFLMGGQVFRVLLVIDAALVLAGAVLTSFVGVTGLVQRMALDQCLPQFLLKKNRRGTSHRSSLPFSVLCSSILIVTGWQPALPGRGLHHLLSGGHDPVRIGQHPAQNPPQETQAHLRGPAGPPSWWPSPPRVWGSWAT